MAIPPSGSEPVQPPQSSSSSSTINSTFVGEMYALWFLLSPPTGTGRGTGGIGLALPGSPDQGVATEATLTILNETLMTLESMGFSSSSAAPTSSQQGTIYATEYYMYQDLTALQGQGIISGESDYVPTSDDVNNFENELNDPNSAACNIESLITNHTDCNGTLTTTNNSDYFFATAEAVEPILYDGSAVAWGENGIPSEATLTQLFDDLSSACTTYVEDPTEANAEALAYAFVGCQDYVNCIPADNPFYILFEAFASAVPGTTSGGTFTENADGLSISALANACDGANGTPTDTELNEWEAFLGTSSTSGGLYQLETLSSYFLAHMFSTNP